jgi:high-affinity iron transporter
MFQSLVITLREGVEAALIVGIVSGYLKKTGRASSNRVVYWALFAGVVASLALGFILHGLQLTELGDAYEGWLMLAGAVFVASMIVWMWRTGRRLKQEIETRLSSLAGGSRASEGWAAWGLFFFVFLMVFREGTETVLFLAAVSLRTTELMNFSGGVIGLGLAIGLGVAFFKGSLKVNLRKFFAVTTLVLLVVAVQLFVSGLHELSEAGTLPSGPREMAVIGPIVNRDAFFFMVVVALCLFLVVAERIQKGGMPADELARLTAPERRKVLAEEGEDRFWKTAAAVCGLLIIVFIGAEFVYSRAAQAMSPPERLFLANAEVRVPVAALADRKLHRFVVSLPEGGEVRLIAVLDASDTVRAALDACMICGTQGYYQDGGNVICRNCAAAINVPTIGLPGGCNPIHIDYRVEGGTLVVPQSALLAGAKLFQKR